MIHLFYFPSAVSFSKPSATKTQEMCPASRRSSNHRKSRNGSPRAVRLLASRTFLGADNRWVISRNEMTANFGSCVGPNFLAEASIPHSFLEAEQSHRSPCLYSHTAGRLRLTIRAQCRATDFFWTFGFSAKRKRWRSIQMFLRSHDNDPHRLHAPAQERPEGA